MAALGRLDQAAGISAMNAINTTIVQSLFILLFVGTTLTSLSLSIMALFPWHERGATAMVAAGVLYLVAMFVVTMVFNVPLNNTLAVVNPANARPERSGRAT
jgi:uncharacterized membrane protein